MDLNPSYKKVIKYVRAHMHVHRDGQIQQLYIDFRSIMRFNKVAFIVSAAISCASTIGGTHQNYELDGWQ
jgi:hypothetical protein